MSEPTLQPSPATQLTRLDPSDRRVAKQLFEMMAAVFDEDHPGLSDRYVDELLAREEFWAIAALSGDEVVGGLTAHTLAMTRAESREIFIYDVAVRRDHQRQGIGRRLLLHLQHAAAASGITEVFVPADAGDLGALDFYRALGGAETPVAFFTFDTSLGVPVPRA